MKKLLLILMTISLGLVSCENEDVEPVTQDQFLTDNPQYSGDNLFGVEFTNYDIRTPSDGIRDTHTVRIYCDDDPSLFLTKKLVEYGEIYDTSMYVSLPYDSIIIVFEDNIQVVDENGYYYTINGKTYTLYPNQYLDIGWNHGSVYDIE